MSRSLAGFAFLCLLSILSHPRVCLAQSQSLDDQKYTLGEIVIKPDGSDNSHTFMIGRPRKTDPNDPWSDATVNAFTSIRFYHMNPDVRAHLKLPKDRGLIVARVDANSPEQAMGIRAQDIILTLGDALIANPADFLSALKRLGDESVPLVVLRNGETVTIQAHPRKQYGLSPATTERSVYVIGVMTEPVDPLLRAQLKLPGDQGLAVRHVDEKGPASQAKLAVGDILISLNGKPVQDELTLSKLIQENGEKPISLNVIHQGDEKVLTLSPVRKVETVGNLALRESPQTVYVVSKRPGLSGHDKLGVVASTVEFVGKTPSVIRGKSNESTPVTGSFIGTIPGASDGTMLMLGKPIEMKNVEFQVSQNNKALAKTGNPATADPAAKRLEEISIQIDTIRKMVEELSKSLKDKK